MQSRSAIVIGSGIAGMAAAIRLAVDGFSVKVFEKNPVAGGKIGLFEKNGYRFDSGPSLFTQPENIETLFKLAGEPISEYFNYTKASIACEYFYENGTTLTAFSEQDAFVDELKNKLGEDRSSSARYLRDASRLYKNIGEVFLNHSLHKRKTWLNKRIFPAIAALKPTYLFSSLHRYNSSKFSSPEATQLFNRYATYNGSNPYKAPAMLSLIPHLEHNEGTFYPEGGMISIAEAVYKLALKKSVEFFFDSPVERIIESEGCCRGVVVNKENIFSDVVISNMDVFFTYRDLLHNNIRARKVLKQERSSSALIFYWGIKKSFPQLDLHNIFFTKNYEQEFWHIFKKRTLYNDPTVYINITSKKEAAHSPAGTENWFVMVNVPANTGQDWTGLKARARKNILEKLSRMLGEDVESLIAEEESLDPVGIEAGSGSYMGSLYGTSSNSKMSAFFRHPNFSREIKNLYFCGGSVHPGGGIPLCFRSAKIVSELISHDIKKHH